MTTNTGARDRVPPEKVDGLLLNALYKGGLDEIADLALDILGNPVFIRDNSQALLAVTRKDGPFDHFISELQDKGYFDDSTIEDIKKHKQQYVDVYTKDKPVYIDNDLTPNPPILSLAVYFKNVIVGYVGVVGCCSRIEEDDSPVLIKIGRAVAIAIEKDNVFRRNLGLNHEQFMFDLLEMDFKSEHNGRIFEARLRNLNKHFEKNMFLAVFQFLDGSDSKIQNLGIIAHEIRDIFSNSLSCCHKNNIVILFSNDNDEPLVREQKEAVERILERYKMVCIVSQNYPNIADTSIKYRCICDMLPIGIKLHPKAKIHFSAELILYGLFREVTDKSLMLEGIPTALFRLIDYDKKTNSSLSATLYYFLVNQKNTKLTASQLSVHRNTLVYRLNRINEITNFDLGDEMMVFRLLYSFKFLEYSSVELGEKPIFVLEDI